MEQVITFPYEAVNNLGFMVCKTPGKGQLPSIQSIVINQFMLSYNL